MCTESQPYPLAEEKMKHQIGKKLKGIYPPSTLNWIIFYIFVIVPTFLFSFIIGDSVSGALKAFPFIFIISLVISSEINLRRVEVNEDFISSSGPLKLYRQKLETEYMDAIRRNDDYPVEVMYKGRAIVFASNRRFKKKITELMQELEPQ